MCYGSRRATRRVTTSAPRTPATKDTPSIRIHSKKKRAAAIEVSPAHALRRRRRGSRPGRRAVRVRWRPRLLSRATPRRRRMRTLQRVVRRRSSALAALALLLLLLLLLGGHLSGGLRGRLLLRRPGLRRRRHHPTHLRAAVRRRRALRVLSRRRRPLSVCARHQRRNRRVVVVVRRHGLHVRRDRRKPARGRRAARRLERVRHDRPTLVGELLRARPRVRALKESALVAELQSVTHIRHMHTTNEIKKSD